MWLQEDSNLQPTSYELQSGWVSAPRKAILTYSHAVGKHSFVFVSCTVIPTKKQTDISPFACRRQGND